MRFEVKWFLISIVFVIFSILSFATDAHAGTDDDLRGWVWNDNIGWISMNCVSAGTCGAVNYGVDLTPANDLVGYGWSANVGWMCFGATCGGITPEGVPAYATVDPVTHEARGWANVISLGANGWVSLNCDNVPPCADYAVTIDNTTGVVSGWAWNADPAGTGLGWFDFSWASIVTIETNCADGLDNDTDGLIDCADPDCVGQPGPGGGICGEESGPVNCSDFVDNDGDGLTDCADPSSCWHLPGTGCPDSEIPLATCFDGVDNDFDDGFGVYDGFPLTGADCLDTDCAADPSCPETETICNNNVDDDLDSLLDCADDDCDPQCTGECETDATLACIEDSQCPADMSGVQNCIETIFPWLKTFFQDIYSSREITSSQPPPTGQVNATYCLLSATGGIVNFRSDPAGGCEPPPSPAATLAFPRASTKYTNILGRLDLDGIRAGRYGPVVPITALTDIPSALGGKIYLYEGGGTLTAASLVSWSNGVGSVSGAGTIVIVGDLALDRDQIYDPAAVSNFKNLASVGWLVLDDGSGTRGNVTIHPAVRNLVGVFYAEGSIRTGVSADPLAVYGAMIARSFTFERTGIDPAIGSEEIISDGRAGINPPPGLGDITKNLPEIRSTAP